MKKDFPAEKIVETLTNSRVFSQFHSSQIHYLISHSTIEFFEEGVTIIEQNRKNEKIYVIMEGIVSVYVEGELILKLKRAGDVIGEMSVLTRSLASATVIADTPLTLFAISSENIHDSSRSELNAMWLKILSDILSAKLNITNQKLMGYQAASAELDQKKRELHQKTLILQSVMGSMGDGVVITDDTGNLMHVNDAFTEMVGNIYIPPGTDKWPGIAGLFQSNGTPLISFAGLSLDGQKFSPEDGKDGSVNEFVHGGKDNSGNEPVHGGKDNSGNEPVHGGKDNSGNEPVHGGKDDSGNEPVHASSGGDRVSQGREIGEIYVKNSNLKEKVWLQASASVLKMPDGTQPGGTVIVFRDYTRKKHEEQALIRAKENAELTARAKTNFLSVMSHELRTPLSGILGMAQALKNGDINPDQLSCVDAIIENSNELLGKIKNILEYNQLESGALKLITGTYSLESVVREIEGNHRDKAAARGIILDSHIDGFKGCFYKGDEKRLIQILDILMDNAVKFSPDKGRVTLLVHHEKETLPKMDIPAGETPAGETPAGETPAGETPAGETPGEETPGCNIPGGDISTGETKEERLVFEVSDKGPGLSEDQIESLFTPFSQADSSYGRKFEGTGLGLAVCKKLIETMKGSISVESRPGKGSCFKFFINQIRVLPDGKLPGDGTAPQDNTAHPDSTAHQDSNAHQDSTAHPNSTAHTDSNAHTDSTVHPVDAREKAEQISGKKRRIEILVAEDNKVNQMLIKKVLGKMGYAPTIVDNGEKAVQACEERLFPLILMDIQMPGMDGIEASRSILGSKTRHKRMPFIAALTANISQGLQEECEEAGMKAFLIKPLDVEKLQSIISRVEEDYL
ncbi:MAG: response regulator [Desulfamplus sp.]|nr:response regulator [Desulfamplus sp.]